jgi:1-phosphofructokinase family hexose kinase
MQTILTINLNPALDEIVHVDGLRQGRLRSTRSTQVFPGGKGVNVTRALRALGIRSSTVVVVAGENGHSLVRGLKKERLSFSAFQLSSGETRVNRTIIEDPTGRVERAMGSGPRWSARDQRGFCDFFFRALGHASVLVLSGRLPPGVPASFYKDLICEAHSRRIAVFLDTSGAALKAGIQARPFAIKPNRDEAEESLGIRLSSRRAIRNALHSYLDYGMKMVLLTLGEQGLAVADGEDFYFVQAPRVGGGHAVGCGDAALAGFIAGWQRKDDLVACARLAAACGAANLLSDVPGGITRNAVKRIAAKIRIERL